MCVFITAVPITKLFAWREGDRGGHVSGWRIDRVSVVMPIAH